MNIPRIQQVIPHEGHILVVTFTNGEIKQYDINRLLKRENFAPLRDPVFFKNIHIEPGGYAVSWNSELDISEYELWQHGETLQENNFGIQDRAGI